MTRIISEPELANSSTGRSRTLSNLGKDFLSWKKANFLRDASKSLSHRQISRDPLRSSDGRVADGVADNFHTQTDALLTALLTTVKRCGFSRKLVRNSTLDQVLQWLIGFWWGELHRTTIEPSTRQFGLPA